MVSVLAFFSDYRVRILLESTVFIVWNLTTMRLNMRIKMRLKMYFCIRPCRPWRRRRRRCRCCRCRWPRERSCGSSWARSAPKFFDSRKRFPSGGGRKCSRRRESRTSVRSFRASRIGLSDFSVAKFGENFDRTFSKTEKYLNWLFPASISLLVSFQNS